MSYKSSEGRDTGKLTSVFRSVKTVLGQRVGQGGVGVTTLPITATGGNTILTPGDGWKYHLFTSTGPGTFTVTNAGPGFVEVILVGGAGGGGGGANSVYASGTGGGGGGVFYNKSIPISTSPGSYTVVVGSGGAGGVGQNAPGLPNVSPAPGSPGNPSTGFGYTAYAGTGGGAYGGSGGTAGSGGNTSSPRTGNSESPPVGWGWPGAAGGIGGGAGGTPTKNTAGIVIGNFYFSEGGAPNKKVVGSDYSAGHGGVGGRGGNPPSQSPGGTGGTGDNGIVIVRYRDVV